MFNFKELKLDKREDPENTSSFVGIRRTENNELEFRLRKGFDNFPENDFNATKQLFFKMYRTFKKFENDKTRLPIDERPAGKDNIETMGNAYRFKDKEDNEVLLYSKISVIENLLEAYRDLALDVIERRYGLDEKIDYSKIDLYLHKAVYLPNDVIYLDEMELPRHVLRYESTTIIDLFCFILTELETELEQESDERVKELSYRFKEQHLSHEQSLFNEETFEITIGILKDVLEDIDKITAYKDEDYWRLYEAIESFLYGELDMENTHEEGIFWGINNFWAIWEDMCNTYVFFSKKEVLFDKSSVFYVDTNIKISEENLIKDKSTGFSIYKNSDFENPFFIKFRTEARWMRPDLIREKNNDKEDFFQYQNHIEINSMKFIEKKCKSLECQKQHQFISFKIKLLKNGNEQDLKRLIKKLKHNLDLTPFKRSTAAIRSNTSFHTNYVEDYPVNKFYNFFSEYISNNELNYIIIDWKYMDEKEIREKNQKLNNDISKQICYEFCLNKSTQNKKENIIIESQFFIPFFHSDKSKDIGDFIDDKFIYHKLSDNGIRVFKANFQLIQEVYLNHD